MANEMVVVEKVTRGHLKSSSKVISKYIRVIKLNTMTKFVSGINGKVIYLARARSLTMDIEMLAVVGLDTRGY